MRPVAEDNFRRATGNTVALLIFQRPEGAMTVNLLDTQNKNLLAFINIFGAHLTRIPAR
jgi:hypothetical protein